MENVLPNAFYRHEYAHDANHLPTVRFFEELSTRSEHDVRLHLDIKNGLTLQHIFDLPNDSEPGKFWRGKLPNIIGALKREAADFPCYRDGMCHAPENCGCRLLSGNRDKILERFIDFCDRVGAKEVAGMLDKHFREEWMRIGKFLFGWGCACDRLRS